MIPPVYVLIEIFSELFFNWKLAPILSSHLYFRFFYLDRRIQRLVAADTYGSECTVSKLLSDNITLGAINVASSIFGIGILVHLNCLQHQCGQVCVESSKGIQLLYILLQWIVLMHVLHLANLFSPFLTFWTWIVFQCHLLEALKVTFKAMDEEIF